ncbi:MAG: DUF1269 domain-containing protein [Pirellulaceae bacterium]|nr:DUF1269 domain-containing protein [Pirellulaceae bacterium]
MSEQCLIAEYESVAQMEIALEVLNKSDFTLEQYSVVMNADDPALRQLEGESTERESESPPTSGAVGTGTFVGGVAAAPLSAATLIGPFMILGPLVGMAAGAAAGGVLSSIQRWGVTEDAGAEYEKRVEQGSVLVIFHDSDESQVRKADRLLMTTRPRSLETFELSE